MPVVRLYPSVVEEERLHDPRPAAVPADETAAPRSAEVTGALRLPEAWFSGLIAISVDAIVAIDESQHIVLFNRGAEQMFGYTAAEVTGRSLDVLLPEQFRARHRVHVERFGRGPVAARRMGERGEILGRRKSGEIFPAEASIAKLDVDGQHVYTAVLRDVTERRRAEAERAQLLEREQRARATAEAAERRAALLADASALLERSLDFESRLRSLAQLAVPALGDLCIIDVLREDGSVRRLEVAHADPALADSVRELLLHPRRSDVPYLTRDAIESGRSVLAEEVTPDVLAAVTQDDRHRRALEALGPTSYIVVPLVARERTLGAIALIANAGGRRYGPAELGLAEELARRAALAVDNARLYGEAQRATRARDEILGIVSHDLRNPLSAITMCASALDDSLEASSDSLRYMVETIRSSAEWMNRLIQDLLDIASIETGHLSIELRTEPVAPLLAKLAQTFASAAAEQGIRLVTAIDPGVECVMADGERVLQVLANLVGNALKFTPSGGEIRVHAAPVDAMVRFSVRDSGSGIPAEHLPHLFDRFWQARRGAHQRGTGLGLAISKGIVEAHGGRMRVESTVGQGSTFTVELPAARTDDTPEERALAR